MNSPTNAQRCNPHQETLLDAPKPGDIETMAKVLELERELKTRKHFYPKWIQQHKISQDAADRRILIIEAILADYNQVMTREVGPMPTRDES